ncbi:MAG TPA: RbsD/FucU domain-containing protein [Acidimicrobiales bacterium]|nr:RbsD/FucU domain-containing protein [Acidimicrobiales bacterium]
MLKNIDPRLTPELLYVMAAMGHGDELAIVDANFPALSTARRTCHGRAVPVAAASMPEVLEAVLSLLPLDDFVDVPARCMAADGAPGDALPEVQQEAQSVIDAVAGRHWPIGAVERFAFYEAARNCYAVVLTGEPRFFGNVIIKKGAIPPPS